MRRRSFLGLVIGGALSAVAGGLATPVEAQAAVTAAGGTLDLEAFNAALKRIYSPYFIQHVYRDNEFLRMLPRTAALTED